MTGQIRIRRMTGGDVDLVHGVFAAHGIRKPKEYVARCWEENRTHDRITLLALYEGNFAGSLHLLRRSHDPYFAERGIPEINDFNVMEPLKRRGVIYRHEVVTPEVARWPPSR
jgi:hypothetical protein